MPQYPPTQHNNKGKNKNKNIKRVTNELVCTEHLKYYLKHSVNATLVLRKNISEP
jgi:hypothetical protein